MAESDGAALNAAESIEPTSPQRYFEPTPEQLDAEERVTAAQRHGSDAASERDDWAYSEEAVSPSDPIRLRGLVNEANERARHPIDLNYIAIPKDDWERIVGLVNRV